MNKYSAYLFVAISLVLLSVKADAHTVKKGTITIGVSAFNENRNFDKGNDAREYDMNLNGGYFFQDNVEIGSGLSYDHYNSNSDRIITWTFSPNIRYYEPLNEKSSIYVGVGVFYTTRDTDYSSSKTTGEDSSGVTIRAGWEYYFNDNVSLDVGLSVSKAEWKLSGQSIPSDKEYRFYVPQISLRVYL